MKKHTFLNILLAGAMLIGISLVMIMKMTNQLKLSKYLLSLLVHIHQL